MKRITSIILLLFLFFLESLLLEPVTAGERKKPIEYYEQEAKQLFERGAWEEGFVVLKSGMEWYPDAPVLNELLGNYYFERREDENARYYLIRALQEDPENINARYLLISIEERCGYYSSAICYINELLDFYPYHQDLWRKKIGLYRLQGNHSEADRLLERLYQIYPQDSTVRKDYVARLEENYLLERKTGNRSEAIKTLLELTDKVKDNESYYLELSNLQLQQGDADGALSTVSKGLASLPGNESLTIKKAEILASVNRDTEALALLNERLKVSPTPSLRQTYHSVLEESARKSRNNETFRLYEQVYQQTGSYEALSYLLDESLERGKEEEFFKYLAEARKKRGDSFELTYKEYRFYRDKNRPEATRVLYRLYESQPHNYEISSDLCSIRLSEAESLMQEGAYEAAEPHLYFVTAHALEPDLQRTAWFRLYNTELKLKKFEEAHRVLDSLQPLLSSRERYILMKAELFEESGDTESALHLLYSSLPGTGLAEYAEEIALPYIKSLIEEGDTRKALRESERLTTASPASLQALAYAVSTSQMTGDEEKAKQYLLQGLKQFPNELFFIEKQAASLYDSEQYEAAVAWLAPKLDSLPGNQTLIDSYSANSEMLAHALIKSDKSEEALKIIRQALKYDANNPQLTYAQGVAYEKQRRYDSAELYQSPYLPFSEDQAAFKRHLNGLGRRSMKNEVNLGMLFSHYINGQSLAPISTLSYTRRASRNRFSIQGSYTVLDSESSESNTSTPSGQGIQLIAGWDREIGKHWNISTTLGWTNRQFPQIIATFGALCYLPKEWEIEGHGGYRKLQTQPINATGKYLINAGVTGAKNWDYFRTSLKVDGYLMNNKPYFNLIAQLKYFPFSDGTTFLAGTVGAGTAPEANIIDYAMPGSFEKLNVMFGLGGGYLIGKHMVIGIDGLYYTLYSQSAGSSTDNGITTKYKNMISIYGYFTFYF